MMAVYRRREKAKQQLAEILKNRTVRVLIDMDNTIADYSTPMAKALNDHFRSRNKNDDDNGGGAVSAAAVDFTADNWSQQLDLDPELVRPVQQRAQSQPKFFYHLKAIPGALEALLEMDQMGFQVLIVSSPSVQSDTCSSDKVQWLREHLGDYWARKLILTKDKTVIIGDFLIDDRDDVIGYEAKPTWKHIIYRQPYNAGIKDDRPHLENWNEWINVILENF